MCNKSYHLAIKKVVVWTWNYPSFLLSSLNLLLYGHFIRFHNFYLQNSDLLDYHVDKICLLNTSKEIFPKQKLGWIVSITFISICAILLQNNTDKTDALATACPTVIICLTSIQKMAGKGGGELANSGSMHYTPGHLVLEVSCQQEDKRVAPPFLLNHLVYIIQMSWGKDV